MTKPDQVVWLDVLSYLRANYPEQCRQWFEELSPLGADQGVFRVRVDGMVRLRYLERQCAPLFTEALQSVTGRLLPVKFCEQPLVPPVSPHTNGGVASINVEYKGSGVGASKRADYHDSLVISPDYTFDNFIVGPENRLAHAAALAVCDNPGRTYNPLFIHGGVGLGKTHLLQAICQTLMSRASETVIYYTSCEGFMTQFMDAVQAGQMSDFRHRFREVDCLVLDDIQFLAKRERTQEEFFHTFNALYQAGKQIVLSSDAPPQDIPDLEARLVSRFQCGLVVEMNPPTFETRVQIVKRKALIRGMSLPDDAACYIANNVGSNVRELEGAVVRVHMQRTADQTPADLTLVRSVLKPSEVSIKPEVTISNIIDTVVEYYGVKLTDLQSKRRQKSIAHPRQVCMYLARRHTRYSLEEIGGYFGGRDHTTVMHAVRTIERRRTEDEHFGKVLEGLEERFRQTT